MTIPLADTRFPDRSHRFAQSTAFARRIHAVIHHDLCVKKERRPDRPVAWAGARVNILESSVIQDQQIELG